METVASTPTASSCGEKLKDKNANKHAQVVHFEVSLLQLFTLLQLHTVSVMTKAWILELEQEQWPHAIYLDGILRQKKLRPAL